jgi:ABC-type uncharacterized transport system auxiliary subunit
VIERRAPSRRRALRRVTRGGASVLVALCVTGCIRGKLPPREFYRLTFADSAVSTARSNLAPPLSASIAIVPYETPGIYGSGSVVYRVGAASYGAYPSREWAIPLGEMLGTMTETVMRRGTLTSGRALFDPALPRREQYEWRGTVREFDEVDAPNAVSAAVVLSAQLVRVADDSVVWAGAVRETEPVRETRKIESVIAALSLAASRAIARLTDDAASTLRSVAAARAQDR